MEELGRARREGTEGIFIVFMGLEHESVGREGHVNLSMLINQKSIHAVGLRELGFRRVWIIYME